MTRVTQKSDKYQLHFKLANVSLVLNHAFTSVARREIKKSNVQKLGGNAKIYKR